MADGTYTIDLTANWADEADSRGLTLASIRWSQEEQGWRVVVRDGDGRAHDGLIPLVPGGPLALRYQFAAFCEAIAHAGDPAPPEMRFFGRNLLPPWMT